MHVYTLKGTNLYFKTLVSLGDEGFNLPDRITAAGIRHQTRVHNTQEVQGTATSRMVPSKCERSDLCGHRRTREQLFRNSEWCKAGAEFLK